MMYDSMGGMTLMADRILAGKCADIHWPGIQSMIAASPVIVIENVAQYWFSSIDKGDFDNFEDEDVRRTFPVLAPPFEQFFMEMGPRDSYHAGFRNKPLGFYVATTHQDDGTWRVVIYIISDEGNGEFHYYSNKYWILRVADDGSPLDLAEQLTDQEITFFNWGHILGWNPIGPMLLAIAFMNCKNVKLIPHDPSLNVHRHKIKTHHKPRVRYHTLEISPMKEILRKEGDIEHNGLKMALHICRGHFKDYRAHGLFGRNKGLYWWDSHVRGSLNEGVVIKDYKVNEPANDSNS